jgi:hypothetical protein
MRLNLLKQYLGMRAKKCDPISYPLGFMMVRLPHRRHGDHPPRLDRF